MITKNNTVGLKELRENLESYVTRINKGESFTVIRRSEPIFKVTPIDEEDEWETVVDFTKINKSGVPIDKVRRVIKKIFSE